MQTTTMISANIVVQGKKEDSMIEHENGYTFNFIFPYMPQVGQIVNVYALSRFEIISVEWHFLEEESGGWQEARLYIYVREALK
jgi:hypothetical protein